MSYDNVDGEEKKKMKGNGAGQVLRLLEGGLLGLLGLLGILELLEK